MAYKQRATGCKVYVCGATGVYLWGIPFVWVYVYGAISV